MHASAYLTASGLVLTGPGRLIGVLLAGGSAASTVTIYDNTTASGAILAVLKCAANTAFAWTPEGGQAVSKGLYAVIAGTAAAATIVYA